jgi:hypothetical protein
MSMTVLKERLRSAKRTWSGEAVGETSGLAGYVPGVLRGFTEALRIVQAYHQEELKKAKEGQQEEKSLNARALYRACQSAFRRLQQSDRKGAMKALSRVL